MAVADVPLSSPAPEPTEPQPSSVPPTTGGPAVDNEAPGGQTRPSRQTRQTPTRRVEPPPPPTHPPGSGIGAGLGFGFGGNTLATLVLTDGSSNDLKAGDGLAVNVSGMGTPFWPTDSVGFGLGAEIGLKYRAVTASNGGVSFIRFPAVVFGQMLARATERGAFLLRAGAEYDLGAHVSGDGIGSGISADLTSHVGFVGEAGLWFQPNNHAALTLTFRYTHLTYSVGGNDIAASNAGVMVGYVFDPR